MQKSGRTSGHTFGLVESVSYITSVSGYCCGNAYFEDQIQIMSDVGCSHPPCVWTLDGDSGSAVLNMDSPPKIIGLHFAGPSDGSSGVANPISEVLSAFDLTLDPYSVDGCLVLNEENCPVLFTTMNDPEDLRKKRIDMAYAFRDQILTSSKQGQKYVDLFHNIAFNLTSILLFNKDLLTRTRSWMEEYEWVIESIVDEESVEIPRSAIEDTQRLIMAIEKHANEQLIHAIRTVRRDLNNPKVLKKLFGITVREAMKTSLATEHTIPKEELNNPNL